MPVRKPATFLSQPGRTGNYASTPDAAPLDLATELDVMARILVHKTIGFVGGAKATAGKYNAGNNQRSWRLNVTSTGALGLNLSSAGTAATNATSSTTLPQTNESCYWVRATWRASDGRVQFFYAPDSDTEPTSWTQLGTDQTIAIASLHNSTQALTIGATDAGGAVPFLGNIYHVIVKSTIGGTKVFDANFAKIKAGSTTFTEGSTNAATVTINTSGSPASSIRSRLTAGARLTAPTRLIP